MEFTITFETQQELDGFGRVFNNGAIANAARAVGLRPEVIYTAIRAAGGEIHTGQRTIAAALS